MKIIDTGAKKNILRRWYLTLLLMLFVHFYIWC